MQDGEGIQDALATCAFDNLAQLLKLELVAPVRIVYLERCAENLMKSACMPQSLELFMKIVGKSSRSPSFIVCFMLTCFLSETNPKKGRKKVVDSLARKFKLLEAFFVDLQKYKQQVQAAEVGETSPASVCTYIRSCSPKKRKETKRRRRKRRPVRHRCVTHICNRSRSDYRSWSSCLSIPHPTLQLHRLIYFTLSPNISYFRNLPRLGNSG